MAHAEKHWSDSLINTTRENLMNGALIFHPEKGYCVKRFTDDEVKQFGHIPILDYLQADFSIHLNESTEVIPYDDIEALIEDGWVLD